MINVFYFHALNDIQKKLYLQVLFIIHLRALVKEDFGRNAKVSKMFIKIQYRRQKI